MKAYVNQLQLFNIIIMIIFSIRRRELKLINDVKVKNEDAKRNWDFKKFHYDQFYQYGWKKESSNNLTLNYPIPGCKFGGGCQNLWFIQW